jgi:hypothetical protein
VVDVGSNLCDFRLHINAVLAIVVRLEVGEHYRTERGPGSPAGQPRWGGGGCAGS